MLEPEIGVATPTSGGTMDTRRHALRGAGVFILVALALALGLIAAPAPARAAGEIPHEITWAHSNPGLVERFVIYVSPVSGDVASARRLEVGKPVSRTIGAMQVYSTIVSIDLDHYVAVGAIGFSGVSSELSAWSAGPPSRPGQPLIVTP
jgi:hypothetical protein